MACRIMIADDHEFTRKGIEALLSPMEEFSICAQAVNGLDAVNKAREHDPDLIISDIGMPVLNGVAAARRILRESPQRKILMFTVGETREIIRAALEVGIQGLVFKTDPATDLLEAIHAVTSGRMFFTRQIDEMILAGYLEEAVPKLMEEDALTQRENEVIQLLAEGRSSKEIAGLLGVSVKTVETHRSRIMRKLKFHNVTGITLYAVAHHIIEVPVMQLPNQSRAVAALATN